MQLLQLIKMHYVLSILLQIRRSHAISDRSQVIFFELLDVRRTFSTPVSLKIVVNLIHIKIYYYAEEIKERTYA